MRTHTLHRTGDAPLRFEGECVAAQDCREFQGREQEARWFEAALYRTAGGQYVLQVVYRTTWDGEAEHRDAQVVGTDLEDIRGPLDDMNPVQHVQGFPPHPKYAEKQRHLLDHMERMWQHLVGELLSEAGIAEEIE